MKNEKNNITELVFIIDRSGSMAGFEKDTVGGFNSILKEQKEKDGKVFVSTVFFDNDSQVIHDRLDINDVEPLKEKDYRVGGCTALLDALGDAIHHIGNIHKYARPEDVPDHTMFVVTTDGQENASHKYSSGDVKKKIRRQSEKYGWEFLFLAANIDAVETAESIGIRGERAANFGHTAKGVKSCYAAMSEAISAVREERPIDGCAWKKKIK